MSDETKDEIKEEAQEEVQEEVHPGLERFRVRQDQVSMPQVQEHEGETANHLLSDRNLQKELRSPMECPHCGESLPSKTCPDCRENVPEDSRYCMMCGSPFEEEGQTFSEDDAEGLDLDNRVLCPDGTCTGIIENGRCTECGKRPGESGAAGGEAEGAG